MAGSNVYISTTNPEHSQGESCVPGGVAACAPECLVHPQFFCGQLLTDQDLNDLLAWAKNKFQLSRYRLGWGVVCGLQVTCDTDDPSAVLVASGYALDSCGNDIVVCKPDRIPLSDACRLPPMPCADPSSGMTELSESSDSEGEYRVVDLFVRYKSVPGNPLPALGRGACTEQEVCEPSRTEESYEFYWRGANGTAHPQQSSPHVWECNYFSLCREVVDRVVDAADDGKGNYGYYERFEAIRNELLSWVGRHPPHQFCFLRDAIGQLSPDAEDLPQRLASLLTWILMDCRLAYLSQGCVGGDPEQGVPLARAVLRLQSGPSGCCVTYIDSVSPYRRALTRDRWPALPGMFNLGPLVWQRMETACAEIRGLGLQVAGAWHESIPETPDQLQRYLDEEWPKGILRSDLNEPPVGLFLDLSCSGPETPCYEVVVYGGKLEPGAGDFGMRAVSFSLNEVPCGAVNGWGQRQGQGVEIDALTDIHGIGRERASKLRQKGIRTFAQLACSSCEAIQELFPRVRREDIETWLKLAAKLKA